MDSAAISDLAYRSFTLTEWCLGLMVLVVWRRLDRTGRLVGGWALAAVVAGLLANLTARLLQNSQYTVYLWFPVSLFLVLTALGSMHDDRRTGATLRKVWIGYMVAWLALLLTVDHPGNYSLLLSPLHALLIAGAAAFTMVTRVGVSQVPLMHDSDFVIATGWLLYAIPTVILTNLTKAWLATGHLDEIMLYFSFRNAFSIFAYLLIGWGLLLGRTPRPQRLAR